MERKLTGSKVQMVGKRNFAPAVDPAVIEKVVTVAVSRLDLSSYIRDEYFQASRSLVGQSLFDPATAQDLAEHLVDPQYDLEPVDVFDIEGRLYLVHGFTRDGAYQLAGRLNIPAIVHTGTRIQAFEFALQCNAKPERPLSNQDKWKRVRAALTHYGFDVSNAEIARKINRAVSERFVGIVREKMDQEFAQESATNEPDAPAAPVKPVQPVEPAVRTVVRGGKEFTMKTGAIGKKATRKEEPAAATQTPVFTPPPVINQLPPKAVVGMNGHFKGSLATVAEMPDQLAQADDDELVELIITRRQAKYLQLVLAQEYDDEAVAIKTALQDV